MTSFPDPGFRHQTSLLALWDHNIVKVSPLFHFHPHYSVKLFFVKKKENARIRFPFSQLISKIRPIQDTQGFLPYFAPKAASNFSLASRSSSSFLALIRSSRAAMTAGASFVKMTSFNSVPFSAKRKVSTPTVCLPFQ